MPLPSYKTWSGFAYDRINGFLSGSVAASATSFTLANVTGTLPSGATTATAVILDGANTETVSVTNVSGSTVTCSATANAHSANCYVTWQTASSFAPSAYFPLEKADPADDYTQLLDVAYRGSAVTTVAAVQGMRMSSWDLSGTVYADTFGYLLGAFFGAEDYTSGSPNSHAFSVLNSGTMQPTPTTLFFYDAYNTRIFAGGHITSLTITLDPSGLIKWSAKWIGRASGVITTPTTSFTSLKPIPAWTGSLSVASSSLFNTESFEVTLTRENSEQVAGLIGVQDPAAVWVGPVKAVGKVTYWKQDDTQYNYVVNETQPTVLLSSTQGTSSALNIQMTSCNLSEPKIVADSKSYVIEEFSFEGLANSTDATTSGGGISPVKVTLKDAISSSVFV